MVEEFASHIVGVHGYVDLQTLEGFEVNTDVLDLLIHFSRVFIHGHTHTHTHNIESFLDQWNRWEWSVVQP